MLFFTLSILFNLDMPLLAIQLLWLNIVTDGLQDMALSFEREEKEIMNEKPRDPRESVFDSLMIQEVLLSGLTMGLIVFITWLFLVKRTSIPVDTARGYIMMLMVFMQNFHTLNCRSEKRSAFSIPLSRNWFVVLSVIGAIALEIIVMEVDIFSYFLKTTSMPVQHVFYMLLISLPVLLVMEAFKKIKFKRRK